MKKRREGGKGGEFIRSWAVSQFLLIRIREHWRTGCSWLKSAENVTAVKLNRWWLLNSMDQH
jgi:hypothetical protein